MKYLAHYLYVAPIGTFTDQEERPIQSSVLIADTLEDAIDFIAENTSTLNYFEETKQPEIIEFFKDPNNNEYHYDNTYDNGESWNITRVVDGWKESSELGTIENLQS